MTGTQTTRVPHGNETLWNTLPSRIFGGVGQPFPDATPRPTAIRLVHSLQIGTYKVRNLETIGYARNRKDRGFEREPILGYDLFQHVSLTIDILTETVTIASPACIDTHGSAFSWDTVVPFQPSVPPLPGSGLVALTGSIGNYPSIFVLDTGATAFPLCVVDAKLIRKLDKKGMTLMFAKSPIANIKWSVAGVQLHTATCIATNVRPQPFQALVGVPFLYQYRACIDYPRHRLYLHRYRSNEHRSDIIETLRQYDFNDVQFPNPPINLPTHVH